MSARIQHRPIQTLNWFAHEHGIAVRPRGSPVFIASSAAPGCHPRDLPEPLSHALTGRNARRRLHRLLMITEHAIHQAAQALGLWPSTLYTQLAQLEHAYGGPPSTAAPAPCYASLAMSTRRR